MVSDAELNPPVVVQLQSDSPAAQAGFSIGDKVISVNGTRPRDIIQWHLLVDDDILDFEILRGNQINYLTVIKNSGEPLGLEIDSPVFDRVKTCDNHCDFCFIYQLPKGLRKSLYLKDDDYRLSFLYGNFTTLTRFTEADLERVVTERISPLNVSIHSTNPVLRSAMLRNDRGAISLRWLKEILKSRIKVRGQIVLCPEVNDSNYLDETLLTVLSEFHELESIAVVPLGLSKFNPESHLRIHTKSEAVSLLQQVDRWRAVFTETLGRPMVFAADEFYLIAEMPWPDESYYGDFDLYEDGVGMVRHLKREFIADKSDEARSQPDFFHSVDAPRRYGDEYVTNPAADTGLRRKSIKLIAHDSTVKLTGKSKTIITSVYGKMALEEVVGANNANVTLVAVENDFFGGNTAVTGLLVSADINRVLATLPSDTDVFLPDICLSGDKFLDGLTVDDLIRTVNVVPTNGQTLRRIVEA